jgi:multiple sugar transport system permease protein
MVGEFQLPFGQLTAGGVLTLTPVVVAYLLVGRTLVKGLMAGGLKG